MAKNLIIGGAANYKYDDVKYWINSIKKSGFDGDIVLVVTNMKNDELAKIAEKGVQLLAYGQKDNEGNYVSNSGMPPHVERFFHIWNFLNTTYEDEPWGNNNYLQAFGPFFHNLIKKNEIYNVGVMAGRLDVVRDIILLILQLSINRPISIVDQAVYNFILNTGLVKSRTEFFGNNSGWACNLGTTLAAIQSGAGDIGQKNDPTAQIMYQTKYLYSQPTFKDDGTVCNSHDIPFCIVHQYDRVADLADKIRIKYND
jgi:hypothetical protein